MATNERLEGPRLPYVVRKLEGTVAVTKRRYNRKNGQIESYEEREDAGFLVMFPSGHYLRVRTGDDLKRYGLNKRPKPIAADGMILHPSVNVEKTFENMEADIADFVRAKSGPISIPGFDGKLNLPKRTEEESYAS